MESEKKLPREWFELVKNEIPQPFRFEIEDNLDDGYKVYKPRPKNSFIESAFEWDKTKQGWGYWRDVRDAYECGTLQELADKVNKERWDALKEGDVLYRIDERTGISATINRKNDELIDVGVFGTYNALAWFHVWTPIKPKHWDDKEERKEEPEATFNHEVYTTERCIAHLKSLGYKIQKPITTFEEI